LVGGLLGAKERFGKKGERLLLTLGGFTFYEEEVPSLLVACPSMERFL
jgi:hypothetical protein